MHVLHPLATPTVCASTADYMPWKTERNALPIDLPSQTIAKMTRKDVIKFINKIFRGLTNEHPYTKLGFILCIYIGKTYTNCLSKIRKALSYTCN